VLANFPLRAWPLLSGLLLADTFTAAPTSLLLLNLAWIATNSSSLSHASRSSWELVVRSTLCSAVRILNPFLLASTAWMSAVMMTPAGSTPSKCFASGVKNSSLSLYSTKCFCSGCH